MRRIHWTVVCCALLALLAPACSSNTNAPDDKAPTSDAPAPAKATQLQEAAEFKTSGDSSFTALASWWVTQDDKKILLEDPDREVKAWLVDVTGKPIAEAIPHAWSVANPDFDLEPEQSFTPPSTSGWDEVMIVSYKIPPEAARAVQAIARRKGDVVFVALIDAPIAAAQRRGAQLNEMIGGQKPANMGDQQSFADKSAKPWSQEITDAIDPFIKESMEATGVPGLAIAVVQDGQIVFEKGYGVRSEGGEPVTPETRFMIGSNTKSFTSLMMARLIDQGKFTWETPMKELMPEFALGDAALADKLQLYHSVCACTGLPRQDLEFLFQFEGIDTKDRLKELAQMKPTTGLGETFQYSNALVSAGGFAAAHAVYPKLDFVKAYEKALNDAVIKPLGLGATTFRTADVLKENHALPHGQRLDSTFVPMPISYEDAVISVVPAGGLWSNVRDLAEVMKMELAGGKLADESVFVSAKNIERRRAVSVKTSDKSHYGLAMMVSQDKELTKVGHGGNTLGFTTLNNFFPDKNLGIIILSNGQATNALSSAIERRILELLFDGADLKAQERFGFFVATRNQTNARIQAKLTEPPPAAWIDPMLGTYTNDALGSLEIRREGDVVIADAGEWKATVAQQDEGEAKLLAFTGPPLAGLPLQPQPDGSLLLDVGQQKYTFKRK